MYRTRDGHNRDLRFTSSPEVDDTGGGGGGADGGGSYYLDPVLNDGNATSPAAPSPALGRFIEPQNPTGTWSNPGKVAEGDGAASWTTTVAQAGAHAAVLRQFYSAQVISIPLGGWGGAYSGNPNIRSSIAAQPWVPDNDVDALHSIVAEAVISMSVTTPPAAPADYQRYIIPAGATGVWAGLTNRIALSATNATTGASLWIYRTPTGGELIYNLADNKYYYYDPVAVAWQVLAKNMRYQDLSDVTGPFNVGTDGYLVKWNNGTGKMELVAPGASAAHALGTHTDTNWVTPPGVANDGKVVTWDNGTGKFILTSKTVSPIALTDLTDTAISLPTSGQGLVYNGAEWVNGNPTPATHNHSLDSLSDVAPTIGSKVVGSVLKWNGTTWAPWTPALSGLSDVNTAGAVNDYVLTYSGGTWIPKAVPSSAAAFKGATVIGYPGGGAGSVDFQSPAGMISLPSGAITIPAGYTKMAWWAEGQTLPAYWGNVTSGGIVAGSYAGNGGTRITGVAASGVTYVETPYTTIQSGVFQVSAGSTYQLNLYAYNGAGVQVSAGNLTDRFGFIIWP